MKPNETIQEAIDLLAEAYPTLRGFIEGLQVAGRDLPETLDDATERVYDAKHALEVLMFSLKNEAAAKKEETP